MLALSHFVFYFKYIANTGIQAWRRVLKGKLLILLAIMAQLQPWTNAKLIMDLAVFLDFVTALIQGNFFIIPCKVKLQNINFEKKWTWSYWDTDTCVPKKSYNSSCTNSDQCKDVAGLMCQSGICDCANSRYQISKHSCGVIIWFFLEAFQKRLPAYLPVEGMLIKLNS